MLGLLRSIGFFYYNGFKNLTNTSKRLWILVIIKSTIILTILHLFFPNILDKYITNEAKSNVVANNLLNVD